MYLFTAFVFFLQIKNNLVSQNQKDSISFKIYSHNQLEYNYVPSINELIKSGKFIPEDPEAFKKRGPKKIRNGKNIIPGKGLPIGKDLLLDSNLKIKEKQSKEPLLSFITSANNSTPGDPTGEIGRDYYIAAWNSSFRIFNLDGTPAMPAASISNLFGQEQGDPIVLYDSQVDRYIVTSMGTFSQSAINFAISVSNDPINDGWHVYTASSGVFPTGGFPDYPKYSIWSDAYYLTINPANLFALERDKIIDGDPSASIQNFNIPSIATSGFSSAQILDIADDNHPAQGNATLIYLQDDSWQGVSNDHIKLWNVNIDWDSPNNSSISNPIQLATTPFNSVFNNGGFQNLSQPNGPDIDAVQATIMNQAQFRKFPTHNSAIFNFVINTGIGENLAAIRWYELRQEDDGMPWSIFQEGTYSAPEGRHAWMGSMSMDLQGNIGLGYSSMSTSESVSLRYTGRYASDPLGQMTLSEGTFVIGTGNSSSFRYADYAHLSVDPSNDKSFWYVSEYFTGFNTRTHRVGVFQIAPDAQFDIGVVSIDSPQSGSLSNSESITVSVFNYGENEISNFDISYSINGGPIITETFTESIGSSETAQFTFSNSVDMSNIGETYSILVYTSLDTDEEPENDVLTLNVTHLNPNDIGVSEIIFPVSGELLSNSEDVTVTITNYGGLAQNNFDVTYQFNGETITETVSALLEANSSIEYTFTQPVDISAFGTYSIYVYTSLDNDSDPSNDAWQGAITNVNCSPSMNCEDWDDGLQLFQLANINNISSCEGYGDFTNLITDLEIGETYDVTMTTGYGDQYVRIWIDFNDDYNFTQDELVLNNYVLGLGLAQQTITETTQITIPSNVSIGEHLMRVKTTWDQLGTVGVPDDACFETEYGETEDYMVNITNVLDLNDQELSNSQIYIYSDDNKNFNLKFITNYNELIKFTIYDINGKVIISDNLDKNNSSYYSYTFDMSNKSKGVYLIKLGNQSIGYKTKRIIVK